MASLYIYIYILILITNAILNLRLLLTLITFVSSMTQRDKDGILKGNKFSLAHYNRKFKSILTIFCFTLIFLNHSRNMNHL